MTNGIKNSKGSYSNYFDSSDLIGNIPRDSAVFAENLLPSERVLHYDLHFRLIGDAENDYKAPQDKWADRALKRYHRRRHWY